MITIEKIQEKDLVNSFIFLQKTWLDTYVDLGIKKENIVKSFPEKKNWCENFKKAIQKNNIISFVAKSDKKIIGLIFGFKKDQNLIVQSLYINKKFQGKGIGFSLLREIEFYADEKIYLNVLAVNKKARLFYEKNNYKNTKKYKMFKINKEKRRDYIYCKNNSNLKNND